MRTDRRRLVTGALALGASCAMPARAQDMAVRGPDVYPNKPVRLIVTYPSYGSTAVFARLVGGVMAKRLGEPLVPEYHPGNGAISAAASVAHAAPDGYTMLIGDISTFVLNKSIYRNLPYDPQKDFAPITLTVRLALVLLVNKRKIPVKSLPELIEMARRAPDTIEYASPGVGTPYHLTTELLAEAAGIKLKHVPYPDAASALEDLTRGKVGMMFIDFIDARAHLATTPGIKALAIATPDDYQALPGVPTVASSGFPGFEAWVWEGLAVPAGTDAGIIEKLRAAYVETVSGPQIVRRLAAAGFDTLQSTPTEFADYMRRESEKWDKVIRTAKVNAG